VPTPDKVTTEIHNRYNVRYIGESYLEAFHGSKRLTNFELIEKVVKTNPVFISNFLRKSMVPAFCSPLYIGITKNLNNRVYKQHYTQLNDYWEDDSSVSKYLRSNKTYDVKEIQKILGLPHSFALEARIKGLAPRDLMVYMCLMDTVNTSENLNDRESIENLLQIIADPICGRT